MKTSFQEIAIKELKIEQLKENIAVLNSSLANIENRINDAILKAHKTIRHLEDANRKGIEILKNTGEYKTNIQLYEFYTKHNISSRIRNCLRNRNIRTIEQLCHLTEREILQTKEFGRKSLNELKYALNKENLDLNMRINE